MTRGGKQRVGRKEAVMGEEVLVGDRAKVVTARVRARVRDRARVKALTLS